MSEVQAWGPAGLWQRSVAWSLDAVLLAVPALLLAGSRRGDWTHVVERTEAVLEHMASAMARAIIEGVPLPGLAIELLADGELRSLAGALQTAVWQWAWPPVLVFVLAGAVYHVAFECSPGQGSPGKRLLGLAVCDRQGRRLRPARALGRHFAGGLSWLSLNLGHAMAAIPPEHLALHDQLSSTRVLAPAGRRLPAWGWAWLLLLALIVVAATASGMDWALETMTAALERSLYG